MKETKAERAVRQDAELSAFVAVLRRAGNRVDEETLMPGTAYKVDVTVLTPASRVFAVEVQGIGFSHLSRKGFLRDIDKAQKCAAAGWVWMPVLWAQIKSGDALEALAACGVAVEAKERV